MTQQRGRQAMQPVVWLLAVLWLGGQGAGHQMDRLLDGYLRTTDAAGRAAKRGARALLRGVLRILGPLGRLLAPTLRRIWTFLRKVWDWLGLKVLLRILRPIGRFARWLATCAQPAVQAVRRWAQRLIDIVVSWGEPVIRRLNAAIDVVESTASRLGRRIARAWSPVTRAAQRLTNWRRIKL